jgi:hypothetical protein
VVLRSQALGSFGAHTGGSISTNPVLCLAVSYGPDDLYAANNLREIFVDLGHVNNWQYAGSVGDSVVGLAAASSSGPVFAGVMNNGVFRAPVGGTGLTFSRVPAFPTGVSCNDVHASVVPGESVVMAALANGTVWLSEDNGVNWRTMGGVQSPYQARAFAQMGNTYYLAITDGTVWQYVRP